MKDARNYWSTTCAPAGCLLCNSERSCVVDVVGAPVIPFTCACNLRV